MNNETLGDYCKKLEIPYTYNMVIQEDEYCIIRVDGRAFHTFTRPYKRKDKPFCEDIVNAMKAAVEALIGEFCPVVVYTQSDETTVVIAPHKVPFGRKCHKLNSIAASVATAAFNSNLYMAGRHRGDKLATFDARSYGASKDDVLKVLIWRQKDAIKNSISNVARTVFSNRELVSKNSDERLAMMKEKGVDWNSYGYGDKYGLTAFRKVREVQLDVEYMKSRNVPEDVIKKIFGEGGMCVRSVTEYPELPPFRDIANLDQVIFDGVDPILKTEPAMRELFGEEETKHEG